MSPETSLHNASDADKLRALADLFDATGWLRDGSDEVQQDLRRIASEIDRAAPMASASTEALRERIEERLYATGQTSAGINQDGDAVTMVDGYLDETLDAVMEVVAPLLGESERLRQIVTELADESPCDVHDGSCHAHGYWIRVRPCPHGRAQAILRGETP